VSQRERKFGMLLNLQKPRFTKKGREILIIILFVIALTIVVPVTTVFYRKGGEKALGNSVAASYDENFTDGILVLASITNVDANAFSYRLSMIFKPIGKYGKNYDPEADFDISRPNLVPDVSFNVSVDGKTYYLAAGGYSGINDMNIFFTEGDITDYPFDQRTSLIFPLYSTEHF
jgi:hypothetical protein